MLTTTVEDEELQRVSGAPSPTQSLPSMLTQC